MGVFTGGGGLNHPLTGVFALSADFSEYGVPLVGVCLPFRKATEKGFLEMYGLRGGRGPYF